MQATRVVIEGDRIIQVAKEGSSTTPTATLMMCSTSRLFYLFYMIQRSMPFILNERSNKDYLHQQYPK